MVFLLRAPAQCRQEDIQVRYGCQPNAYAGKGILLLKLIVHHVPKLLVLRTVSVSVPGQPDQ